MRFGLALLGNELGVQQVAHSRRSMRVPYWTGAVTPSGKYGSCHGGAGAAEAAMGAVSSDLHRAWLGHIVDLSTDGRAVPVGFRQRCAASWPGGGRS